MQTTEELISGESSEVIANVLDVTTPISNIKKILDTLECGSPRWTVKVEELISTHFKDKIVAVWSRQDMRRILHDYDLKECDWDEYIGYAPDIVEELVCECTDFIDRHNIQHVIKHNGFVWCGAEICVLCDENLIRKNVDPFLCIKVKGRGSGVDDTYFVLHKWGPDITEERKQIVAMKNAKVEKQKKSIISRIFS